MEKQKTLKAKVSFEGIGLHTGDKVGITISPAPPNTGIIFVKEKEGNKSFIKADFYSVLDPSVFPRRTSVGEKGNEIHTIEHLMAAFSLLGVDFEVYSGRIVRTIGPRWFQIVLDIKINKKD